MPPAALKAARQRELSTALVHNSPEPVDILGGPGSHRDGDGLDGLDGLDGHWLGAVLPKRLARRAVTRNLLRRQIRSALQRHLAVLPAGLWVVRLRAGFARTEFLSAASDALRAAARTELDQALSHPQPASARSQRPPRRPSSLPVAQPAPITPQAQP